MAKSPARRRSHELGTKPSDRGDNDSQRLPLDAAIAALAQTFAAQREGGGEAVQP